MNILVGWIIEFFWFVWYGSATIFSLIFHPKLQSVSQKNSIVFVHSWMGQPLAYIFLKRFLEKRGISILFTNFGLETGDINTTAVKLQEYIDVNELQNVTLVGGSIGAIIALVYLEQMEGWKKVKKLICISAPFHGSYLSHFALLSKSARQIKPKSLFLKTLIQGISHKEKIISIAGQLDEFVNPKSSFLEGAKNIQVDEIGHAKMQVFSIKVWEIIAQSFLPSFS